MSYAYFKSNLQDRRVNYANEEASFNKIDLRSGLVFIKPSLEKKTAVK